MATISPNQLPERIAGLLAKRQEHVDALGVIDQALAGIGAALTGASASAPRKAPVAAAASEAPAGSRKRRRRRSKFATSAEESILEFVQQNKNPTTAEIKEHYVGEGRGGTADNALSKLVKDKKLKREPIGPGIRGSRYLVV